MDFRNVLMAIVPSTLVLVGWAAFFKIQNDEMEKDREAAQRGSASRTQTR